MMNRGFYFNYITDKLSILSYQITKRGQINLLDMNIYAEPFFATLVSLLFNYDLIVINSTSQNCEAIDLIDEKNKTIAQVSSTCTKQKIESSLTKKFLESYEGFHFLFIAITGKANKLKGYTYNNPYKVIFSPSVDILDISSLLRHILSSSIEEQIKIYNFLVEELGNPVDIVKIDSNLASIINILSKENLTGPSYSPEINTFEILKKIKFNNLLNVKPIIDDYMVFYGRLNEKYAEFDRQGANISFSILSILQTQYLKLLDKTIDPHEMFFSIVENVIEIIRVSKNFIEIPYEELEMCVSIIVVDAFIRCKIFENPEGYNHVATR